MKVVGKVDATYSARNNSAIPQSLPSWMVNLLATSTVVLPKSIEDCQPDMLC